MAEEQRWLLPKEAAKLAGCSGNLLRQAADRNLLPCIKTVGGTRIFLEADILKFQHERDERKSRRKKAPIE